MPPSGADHFAIPEKGGLKRKPETIISHRMPGALDEELMTNAVTLSLEARPDTEGISVRATILNDQTGHHVPTDSPLRHMILIVSALDENGRALNLIRGPTLPDWCGVGDPEDGYYAGMAGKTFVKLLKEAWTNISPTASYWNPTTVVMDNRIEAFASDVSEYVFSTPKSGIAQIEAILLYRRAYKELMDLKEWRVPDIVMEKESLMIPSQKHE
jgi:hypothetical protein